MNLAPDYEELDNALRSAGLELSAAEMHGIVTATASFEQPPSLAGLLFDRRSVPDTAEADQLVALGEALRDDVHRRLEDTDFAFEPMLGEASLPEKVERLAAWSRGYVLGLAAGGLQNPAQLRSGAGEFVEDAMQIGEAQMDEDDDVERQERDLAEIIEYLRAGVQLVYEELRAG